MPKTIFILAISLFFISICFAQAKEGEKLPDISKMSKKELNNLPKDVLDQIPLKELLKVYKDGASLSEAAVSLMLGRLAYFEPLSEKATREAIKKFQRDIDQLANSMNYIDAVFVLQTTPYTLALMVINWIYLGLKTIR